MLLGGNKYEQQLQAGVTRDILFAIASEVGMLHTATSYKRSASLVHDDNESNLPGMLTTLYPWPLSTTAHQSKRSAINIHAALNWRLSGRSYGSHIYTINIVLRPKVEM